MSGAGDIELCNIERVEIVLEPFAWPFAVDRRTDIDGHFADLRRERPELWNGRVLLLHRYAISNGVLSGGCFETDYASFIAWRDWGFPDRSVRNFFAVAALRAADGAFVLGEMAPHTAGAGQICFPCGTPEPADLGWRGTFDLAGNLRRELQEETGLDLGELDAAPGWTMVRDRGFLALFKSLTAPQSAAALGGRIKRHLAGEEKPELADVRLVRCPADLDAMMPRFIAVFLRRMWEQ